MPISWDQGADARLTVALASTGSPDLNAVAKMMGEGVTVSAIKHRLVRIRQGAGITPTGVSKKNNKTNGANNRVAKTSSTKNSAPIRRKSRAPKSSTTADPIHAGKGLDTSASTDVSSSIPAGFPDEKPDTELKCEDEEIGGSEKEDVQEEEQEGFDYDDYV
ncbi:hypothetical protein N7466_008614 [Penicillium verhagenii]|uniref:uncharacterized protein n=1 Tax=Penicillium verhagenii TaxID=1562060 RepID=UPI00254593AC|nr:uncharacterized protein N7466_008614 [Penicillium verhagenii]KAJ5924427.1 hypothetical protein N7466_008614 [Penicillium verhagenii]